MFNYSAKKHNHLLNIALFGVQISSPESTLGCSNINRNLNTIAAQMVLDTQWKHLVINALPFTSVGLTVLRSPTTSPPRTGSWSWRGQLSWPSRSPTPTLGSGVRRTNKRVIHNKCLTMETGSWIIFLYLMLAGLLHRSGNLTTNLKLCFKFSGLFVGWDGRK